eukprot:4323881-Amphidinium_carterae.1
MAYTTQEHTPQEQLIDGMLEMLNTEDYSPITTPVEEAQQVDSDSSSESSTPAELSGLDVKETFLRMTTQWESKTPEVTTLWWKADEMAKEPRGRLRRLPADLHAHYQGDLQQGCDEGNLGARFLFRSPGQALLHRTIHHHFGLSSADLSAETFVVQCKVSREWIAFAGTECVNGFATSCRVQSMPIGESGVQVVGLIKILDSMVTYLSSDAGLEVTRQSISHFDCIMHCSALGAFEMMTPEIVEAMAVPALAGASKINSTLSHQVPETFERWQATLNRIKDQW